MRARTLRAACGLVGPAVFTSAWIVGTRRQPVYSIANEHISGLAAPDAEVPHLMTAGFLVLGSCTVMFARELERRLERTGPAGVGPSLLAASGAAMVAAGVFRRDRISNYPMPGEVPARQSWRNDAHDLAAVAAGTCGITSLGALAVRFRGDAVFGPLTRSTASAALLSGILSLWFATDVTRPGNGLVQRASITLPLLAMARTAWRMLGDQASASSGT
jgi:hypothetical protein